MARPRLVFLHVPKTAGTTLVGVIEREYGVERIVRVYGGEFGIPVEELVAWSARRRRAVRAVVGHMSYGVAEHLPGRSVYATLLRDPVDRIVSHYSYVLTQPSLISLHEASGPDASLEQHVTRSPLRHFVNNAQTRQLGGDTSDRPRTPGERDLDRAIGRLDHLAVFGIQERFDESMLHFARTLGWELPVYTTVNVTGDRIALDELDASTRATIEEQNALDRVLYDHATQRFQELLARDPIPGATLAELRKAVAAGA
jgi:hypothetical protein